MIKKTIIKELIIDAIYSVVAGVIVAIGLYFFANSNNFAPGGITGVASVVSHLTGVDMAYYMLIFNIPLFILCSIFVERKLGVYLCLYIVVQSATLILLGELNVKPYVASEGTLIFATIATGVVTGVGFSVQIGRHGASGGTYAISALIKRKKPATNIAWLTFIFDSVVVLLVVLFYEPDSAFISAMCTLINLFIANIVVDFCLQGAKEGYKFEIITDDPETISQEIMFELKHGVTELNVQGMYTHKERYMIVCIIRKRELSKMMRIIKKYPKSFASFARVNEVFGNFIK